MPARLTRADADHIADRFIARVIDAVGCDARMPHVSRSEWRELLGDVEIELRDELGELIHGRVREQRRDVPSPDGIVDADQGPWPPFVAGK
jgi:hypothetical protein